MDITCIGDLHGFYPKLDGGDLLIVAGDLTANDTEKNWIDFESWILDQSYKEKIIIGGNHDNFLQSMDEHRMWKYWEKVSVIYLCDSGTAFSYYPPLKKDFKGTLERRDFKIWGTPWTKTFEGMNPHCKAFTCGTENELAEKFALIPEDIDILISHGPPHGVLDLNIDGHTCGSISLYRKSRKLKQLKLFVFGHIHEAYAMINCTRMKKMLGIVPSEDPPSSLPIIVNCSHVNEHYEPVNKPIRVIL